MIEFFAPLRCSGCQCASLPGKYPIRRQTVDPDSVPDSVPFMKMTICRVFHLSILVPLMELTAWRVSRLSTLNCMCLSVTHTEVRCAQLSTTALSREASQDSSHTRAGHTRADTACRRVCRRRQLALQGSMEDNPHRAPCLAILLHRYDLLIVDVLLFLSLFSIISSSIVCTHVFKGCLCLFESCHELLPALFLREFGLC